LDFGFVLPQGAEFGVALARAEFVIVNAVELWRNVAGVRVQEKGYIRGVIRRMAEKDANFGAVDPFVVSLLRLEFVFQDVDG
jgi:hypothetical protein